MRLARDLWSSAPRRSAGLVALIAVQAITATATASLVGPVLVHRSVGWFVLLAGSAVVATVADVVRTLLAVRVLTDWSSRVRQRLCRIALGQDLPTLEDTPVGELLDRIDGDVHDVAQELREAGLRIGQAVPTAVLSVVAALVLWWPAGLAMAVVAVVAVLALRHTVLAIGPARAASEEAWSDLSAVMEEAIHGQDDVRTSLARPYVLRTLAERTAEVLRRGRRSWALTSTFMGRSATITRGGLVMVVMGGAWALSTGRIDAARLTSVWLLGVAFAGTSEQVGHHISELMMALGAWSRIEDLEQAEQEPVGGRAPSEGPLEIRGLTFRYPTDQRRAALRDVELTFRPGVTHAVVGRTGSGKSTLAKVVTRSVDVPPGTVFLDGVDLTTLDLEALRRWITLVPQTTEILAGTVAQNVALFDPELEPAALAALRQLGLGSWVDELPDGVDTRLGPGGHVLSAGQEQLIAFARVLVRDPRVVVLDEATARLDPDTEDRVRRATERLLAGRTGIIIAHRLATVERCDEVVELADGAVVEAGPLAGSARFAQLATLGDGYIEDGAVGSRSGVLVGAAAGPVGPSAGAAIGSPVPVTDRARVNDGKGPGRVVDAPAVAGRTDPPPAVPMPPVRTVREIARLTLNDPRFGLGALVAWFIILVVSLNGALLPWLWADLVDGDGGVTGPAVLLTVALAVAPIPSFLAPRWFPEWWVRQILRIKARLVAGQTGPRRISAHTPGEVVAQSNDAERVVVLADNMLDVEASLFISALIAVITRSAVAVGLYLAAVAGSAVVAAFFRRRLSAAAHHTVASRAEFATAVTSSLAGARTIKLAGSTRSVLRHLGSLDRVRTDGLRRELSAAVLARSTPGIAAGLLPVVVWGLYLRQVLDGGTALAASAALASVNWYAWTAASLVTGLPAARVWTERTVAMAGVANYSATLPGVDLSAGTAPAPPTPARRPLERLDLVDLAAIHDDGTIGVTGVDIAIERGQLVLVVGAVGSGKSSLLRALAGITHHTGRLCWNDEPVTEPERFLRPAQVGYVAQLPRVLSGSIADNIVLGHRHDVDSAIDAAQLRHDLAVAGSGPELLVGHKGTRLSGGQLQRLALARALAPETELLVADDVSSALDIATELALWDTLRTRGVTTVAASTKRAALVRADQVLVLAAGRMADRGRWSDLVDRWGHLAA